MIAIRSTIGRLLLGVILMGISTQLQAQTLDYDNSNSKSFLEATFQYTDFRQEKQFSLQAALPSFVITEQTSAEQREIWAQAADRDRSSFRAWNFPRCERVKEDPELIEELASEYFWSLEYGPNPSSNVIQLQLSLAQESKVSLTLYDNQGSARRALIDQEILVGNQSFSLFKNEMASGMYWLLVEVDGEYRSYPLLFTEN